MAIQKMTFLKIVGSVDDIHEVLKRLVLSESLHVDFESPDAYDNSYIIHHYESVMTGVSTLIHEDYSDVDKRCADIDKSLEMLSKGLDITLQVDKGSIANAQYGISDARNDIDKLTELIGGRISEINTKKAAISQLKQFYNSMDCVIYKDIDFEHIAKLNYFDYEVGFVTNENKLKLRKNYENISAIALNIGTLKNSNEDIGIIIFPKRFREETTKLLKSLNWIKLDIPDGLNGTIADMMDQTKGKIKELEDEINKLSQVLTDKKNETQLLLNKIYTTVLLERKIASLVKEVFFGESTFVINAWIRNSDKNMVEQALAPVMHRVLIEEKKADELERQVMPPTQLKNNKFVRPFETIIRLYGLPSYYEIDPTPFLAITFCLMFGIMFGDIGQGLVYFIAGLIVQKKMMQAGKILQRLGGSSIIFGFVYGSLFGLEQEQLPWLPSLIGKPLDPKNIPSILIAGVVFGVVVMSISFILGVINSIRVGNVEIGIFGKNGLAGYIFYMSLITAAVAVTGVIKLPLIVPILTLLGSLLLMVMKEPLTNLVINKRPLVHGTFGNYMTESIFEGVETVLGTLSNAISFIRVGAFALNHAGLFLAFLVMSELMPNIALKILILLLGNLLILVLEGLVVFIQGLRLQYYEMFGKYFQGDGIEFKPVRINIQ